MPKDHEDSEEPLIVELANGRTILVYPGKTYEYGSAVTVLDEKGEELGHWDIEEWKAEPEQVMGAIFVCAQS